MTDEAAKKRKALEHELTQTMTAQVRTNFISSKRSSELLMQLGYIWFNCYFTPTFHLSLLKSSYIFNFQIELDKTAEEFRKAHVDRQELLKQWESTIDQMQKRDREMDILAVVWFNYFIS